MDGQTVRTALGTIQSNPTAEEAWQTLHDEVLEGGGDLDTSEALNLLQAARERHAARGEYDSVARLLDLASRLEEEPARKVAVLVELSQVLVQELFASARALSVLDKAIALLPDDEAATRHREELRSKAERYEAQARSYLVEADEGNDDEYRSAMLMRAAEVEVCFAPEPDFPKIIENLERALRLDASNLPASRLLEVIYRRQANWDGVVKVLERTADRAPSHADRVAAGIRLARLYQHHYDDRERAAAAYDRVLTSDATQADAMEFVTEYYSKEERWDELVRAYERPLKSGQVSDDTRLGDMFQVAMLHWKKRQQLADAEIWFEKIRALSPAHEGVLNFFREYKASLGDDAGLVQILEDARREIGDEDPRAKELDEEIESLQSEQNKAQKSIEKYKSDLRENPEDAAARSELKTLYKQTQGHNALVELLRQELERTAESDYEKRLSILREIASVYRQYIKSDTALVAVLNQIVHLDGQLDEQDVAEVRELVSLYDKLGRPRDLLAAEKLLAELVADKEEKISLYRKVGRRWLEQFSNAQHAMEAFAALHELSPTDPEAIERLEDLYRKRRAWKELFSLYEQQLESQSGAARVPLLREMAQLAAERLSRVDEAIGLYREILSIDSSRIDVLERLEKLAERAKEWSVLAEVLENRLQLMEKDETQLPILQKLGAVYGDHLERQDEANRTWLRVVEIQPGNPRAMRVLRDSFLKESRFDELELLYTSQNDLEGLAEVLSTAADRNKDAEEKLDLSFRAARVYENQLGQAARAIRSYERILSINPKEQRAIVRLLPLYEEEEKWARIPPLVDSLLELTTEREEKIKMYEQLVTIYSTRLGDKKAAYHSARAAYRLAPELSGTVELLDSAARAAGEWEDALSVLGERFTSLGGVFVSTKADAEKTVEPAAPVEKPKRSRRRRRKGGKQASIAPPSEAQEPSAPQSKPAPQALSPEAREIALRMARVLGEELGRGEEAIARLQDLATSSPSDEEVLLELEKLLRQESRPDDMRWLFNHRQKHATTSVERSSILTEWAVYEEHALGSESDALQHFQEAVEAQADNTTALESVARLALSLDQPEVAVKAIAAHRDLLDGLERAQKDALLADLLAERMNQPVEALDAARRALDGGAESGSVIPVLRRLVEVPTVRGDAARILSEQYEADGDSRQEADAVRALISETRDEFEQIELYKKLADIFEEKLKEPGAALSVVLEALQKFPKELDLWDRAGPLAGQAGRPTDLADAYRNALRGELPDELCLDLARRAAELHEVVLNDSQGSTPYLERVLSIEPDDELAFTRLKETLTAGERWRELEKLYDNEIDRLDSDERKIEMLAEMAMLAEDIIGDAGRAIATHRRILELDPENAAALDGLDRLLTRLEKTEELLPLLQKRAELALGEEQHKHLVRVARIALSLLKPELAIIGVERVLEDDPGNYEARDIAEELLQIGSVRVRAAMALEVVYETKDEIRDLVRVLGVRVEALRPKDSEELSDEEAKRREDERRDLLRRVATLRDDRLHDDVGSFDVFAELSPLDPVDADLRARLIDSGRRLGRSEKVVEVLLDCAKSASEPPIVAEILLQAAMVQSDTLDDQPGAEQTYRSVVALKDDEPHEALVAARAIETMLIGTERHEELGQNLSVQIDLEEDLERKADLIARLAQLQADVLGRTSDAVKTWEMRIADQPDDPEALRSLTELYEKESRFEDVARVLTQRRDAAIEGKERINLARSLADVQERHLGELAAAIESYQSILDEAGPAHDILSALERLYLKTERWDDLGDVLSRLAESVQDEVERLRALADLGRLRVEKQSDLPGALDVYRRALSIDITHEPSRTALAALLENEDRDTKLEAAEILHPIYEADGNHERLIAVLSAEAEATDDPQFRMERYRDAMMIAEDSLHNQQLAFRYSLLGLTESAPLGEAGAWLDAVERLAAATSRREEQVGTLQKIVGELFDAEEQLSIQRRIAELLRSELGDPRGAIAAYQKALDIVSDDRASLSALEVLHTQQGDHGALLEVLGRRIDCAESDTERREISFRRAELLAGTLKDIDAAISAFEGILDLDLDLRAIERLEELYSKTERYEDLVALIQRRIDSGSGDVADLRVQMAGVISEKQEDSERGLDELEQALMVDSQHQGAVSLLERLLDNIGDPALRGRAASLLEPVYMVRADYDRVLNVLLLRLEGADGLDERRELVTRLAQIYEEQKEDYTSALEVTALLLKDDPSDELTLSEMERLAKVAGAELRLGELLNQLVSEIETEDDASAYLCRRAGEIFSAHERFEDALALLRRALAFEPDSPALFDGVDDLLKKVGTPRERVELYQSALPHRFDPDEQRKLLAVIAHLQENKLGNVDEAIAAHKQAVEADETNEASLDALTRLYTQTENWSELAELYLRRAETEGPVDGAKYRIALADLYMRKLGQHEPALDQLEEIVRDQPEFNPAIERLEAMRKSEALLPRVIELLGPIYEANDDWRRIISLNEDRFRLAEDPMDQVAILRETAQLWESRGEDIGRARRALVEAFRLQPEDDDLRTELERLAVMTEAWTELAELYETVLSENPDIAIRPHVVERLAGLYDEKLDNPRDALTRYAQLREIDPSDEGALDHMLSLSLLLGDWPLRQTALEAKSEMIYDDEERIAVLSDLGELRERTLDDVLGAIASYEKAFELDEKNAQVCDRLIALYLNRGEPARLVELYLSRVDGGEADLDQQFELLNEAARIFEKELSEPRRAIECLSRALLVKPSDQATLGEINRLYRSEEMWPELLDNLRLEAGTAATTDERIRVRHQIAHVLADKMDSFDEALEAYGVILDEKPDDQAALSAVFQLVDKEDHLCGPAAELLVPALRQTELREDLIRALRLRLRDEHEPAARVETLRTIAQVYEHDLEQPKPAMDALLEAVAETPEAEELYHDVERLAAITNDWSRYTDTLKQRAAEIFDAELAGRLWVRAAAAFEEHLADARAAISAYQMAAEQTGDRLDLLDALDRLYTRVDDIEAVVALLERRMALVETDADQARLYCRQGQLQLEKQDSPVEAIASFRQALELDLHNQVASDYLTKLLASEKHFDEVFDILDGVFRDRPAGAELAALHQKRVARAASSEERSDLRRSLAQVLEDDCKDPLAAQRVLQEALADDLTDEGLRDELERLVSMTGAWSEGARALLDALEKDKEVVPEVGRDVAERAASWFRDRASDPDTAEEALLFALRFDPDSDEILEQLEALQLEEGKEERLLATLRERSRVAMDDGTRIETLRRCFALAEQLDLAEMAETSVRDILDIDDQDQEALACLTSIRKAARDFDETFELLNRQIQIEDDPDKVRVLKFDAAEVARLHLDKVDEAIVLLQELLEDDAQDAQVITSLQAAYHAAGRYEDLSELINSQLEAATDEQVVSSLKVGLARLRRERFDDHEGAISLLEDVYASDPHHTEAADLLANIYETTEKYADLIDLYGRRRATAESNGDTETSRSLLRRMADVAESQLGDLSGAVSSWREIVALDPTAENKEELLRLLREAGRKDESAALLEEICGELEGDDALVRRAELVEMYRSMGDVDSLVRTVEGSVALAPNDAELKIVLRKEYEAAKMWGRVAGLVLDEAESAQSVESKLALLREAAAIQSQKQGAPGEAVGTLEKAAELAPDDREVLLELCDAYSGSGRGGEAVEVLEKIVESYGGKRSKELGEIHRRLATAHLSNGDHEKALGELDKAFRIEPGNINVLKQLGEVAIVSGDLKKAQQMFRALLLQRLDDRSPITKAEVFCKLGQIHQQLGEIPKAKQMFERALQTDSSLSAAKEGLDSL